MTVNVEVSAFLPHWIVRTKPSSLLIYEGWCRNEDRNWKESRTFSTLLRAEQNGEGNEPLFRPGSMEEATAKMGKVPYGEESRRYRRTVYTHEDWVKHRNSETIITKLNGLFYSGIVRQLKGEIFSVSMSAAIIVAWNDVLLPYFCGNFFISMLPRISLPSLPFQLCSPALGLLLVFKTNASYARWLEARNTWSKIISQARNIVRMASTYVPQTEEGRMSIKQLSKSVWLLCRSIMNDLAGPNDEPCFQDQVTEALADCKDNANVAMKIIESSDRSMAALAHASRMLDSVPIDEKRRVEIDKSLVIIGDCIGICEKIYSSPVPLVCKLKFKFELIEIQLNYNIYNAHLVLQMDRRYETHWAIFKLILIIATSSIT